MTKVTILGEETFIPEKKKIEFKKVLLTDGSFSDLPMQPSKFDNIILLTRAMGAGDYIYDIMYAYRQQPSNGCVYLGHFNDGIV